MTLDEVESIIAESLTRAVREYKGEPYGLTTFALNRIRYDLRHRDQLPLRPTYNFNKKRVTLDAESFRKGVMTYRREYLMKLVVFVVSFLLFALPCAAQSINFAWDYDVVENAKINGFHAWQTKNPGSYTAPFVGTFAPALRSGSLPVPPQYGKWCWVWTAFATNPDSTFTESDYSNEVCENIKPPKPRSLVSTVTSALLTPVKAVTAIAGLFKTNEQLRIEK